jgi:hypothetical protein
LPRGFKGNTDGHGDSIRVTDETAATGRHSLKFTDAPGLPQVWMPELCFQTDYRSGRPHNSFDLRLEPGADISFEWRDYSKEPEFPIGPKFTLHDGKLILEGKELIPVPTRQWLHFEVTADLGPGRTGKWVLQLSIPGQPLHEWKDLAFVSSKFKTLTWIGFDSLADCKTVFYLDDFKLEDSNE